MANTIKPKKKHLNDFSFRYLLMLLTGILLLSGFSIVMISSAEMGYNAGEVSVVTKSLIKQSIIVFLGFALMYATFKLFPYLRKLNMSSVHILYTIVLILLLITRLFGSKNGSYAWIAIGSFTFQPSELAKAFIIYFGSRVFAKDSNKLNEKHFIEYFVMGVLYFIIIAFYQKDFGSAIIYLGIAFAMFLIVPYKEYKTARTACYIILIIGICAIAFIMSPIGYSILEKFSGNYMVGRIQSAINPFKDIYGNGYHLVMSLVSMAQGGLLGLGYGNSIHKYMNFPNPSSDFILAVIIEELGIIGLAIIIVGYFLVFYPIIYCSMKTSKLSSKLILFGTIMYFALHFVLNIGGVSGLIPLTGVPLLLISSGGSSLLCIMITLGMSIYEIVNIKVEK